MISAVSGMNTRARGKMMNKCEVCWADERETIIYEFKGSLYCEDDRERAIAEGWHNA